MRENLLECIPVNLVLTTRCPLADLAIQNATTNLGPLLHIRVHPRLLPVKSSNIQNRKFDNSQAGDLLGTTQFKSFSTHPQALRFLAGVYNIPVGPVTCFLASIPSIPY